MSELTAGRPSKKDKAIASVKEIQESTVKTSFNLPRSLYKQVKQKALDQDISATEIIKKALNEYVNK